MRQALSQTEIVAARLISVPLVLAVVPDSPIELGPSEPVSAKSAPGSADARRSSLHDGAHIQSQKNCRHDFFRSSRRCSRTQPATWAATICGMARGFAIAWVAAMCLHSAAQAGGTVGQDGIPSDWKKLARPPSPYSGEMRCAGLTRSNWVVSYAAGAIGLLAYERFDHRRDSLPYPVDFSDAIDTPPPPPPVDGKYSPELTGRQREWARVYARDHAGHLVARVSDGWLVGFDGGEYGGSLWWYPAEPGPGQKLWSHNVNFIESSDEPDSFVAFSALVGFRTGAVLTISRTGGIWGVRRHTALSGGIRVHTSHAGGWLAATTTELLLISRQGEVTTLAQLPLNSATPISIVVGPGGDIVIGRRFFVSVLRRVGPTYEEDWYVPPACQRFKDGVPCLCIGGA